MAEKELTPEQIAGARLLGQQMQGFDAGYAAGYKSGYLACRVNMESQEMTAQQQMNEIYEAARVIGAGVMTDPLKVIKSLHARGFRIVRGAPDRERK